MEDASARAFAALEAGDRRETQMTQATIRTLAADAVGIAALILAALSVTA